METVTISQELLDQIKELNKKKEGLVREFGEIGIATEELEERKHAAIKYRREILEEEIILTEYLGSKYGNGTLNLDTGEFQPLT